MAARLDHPEHIRAVVRATARVLNCRFIDVAQSDKGKDASYRRHVAFLVAQRVGVVRFKVAQFWAVEYRSLARSLSVAAEHEANSRRMKTDVSLAVSIAKSEIALVDAKVKRARIDSAIKRAADKDTAGAVVRGEIIAPIPEDGPRDLRRVIYHDTRVGPEARRAMLAVPAPQWS